MTVTLHRDLSTVPRRTGAGLPPDGAGFTMENAVPVALPETGPTGKPWLRSTLVDGQTGAGSAIPNERADAQMGGFPIGERRIVRWFERFVEMPTTSLDRWQVVGPEIHGPNVSAFPQAVMMLEVDTAKRRRLNSNAGRASTRYDLIGPIVIGQVYAMMLDVVLSAGSDGYVRVYRDGKLEAGFDGATLNSAIAGSYFKHANYRNAQIDGRMVYDVSDLAIFDAEVADALPVWPPDGAPAEPPASADTTPPRGELVVANDGTWTVTLPDADTATALIGVAGDPVAPSTLTGPGTKTGAFDRSKLTAGVTYWAWLVVKDVAGNEFIVPGGRAFTPLAATPPPDLPGDPCAPVKADLVTAVSERDAARALALSLKDRIDRASEALAG